MKKLWAFFAFFCVSSAFRAQALPNPAEDPSMGDAELTAAVGVPPTFVITAWGGWSYLLKLLRFDRSHDLTRQLDRYSYSFVRLNLRVVSSILTTLIQPRVDLYPLSYLGVTVGHTFTTRSHLGGDLFHEWTRYDCDQISCNGWLDSSFVETKLKFGYERVFGTFLLQNSWLRDFHHQHSLVFEPESALLAKGSGDRDLQAWFLIGARLKPNESVALKLRRFSWSLSEMSNFSTSLLYTRAFPDRWKLGTEVGFSHRSDSFDQAFLNLSLTYSFAPGPEPEKY